MDLLSSDWCSLAAKRKLLAIAIEEFGLLIGPEKVELEQGLKRVTQYRNAFAHGTLAHNGEAQGLHYFEVKPQIVILDDAYFERLESTFLATWAILEQIQSAIKAAA